MATLGGEVFLDTNSDGIKDTMEVGANGIRVYLDANNNSRLDSGELSAQTDTDGAYVLTGVPSGEHILRVETPGNRLQSSPDGFLGVGYLDAGGGTGTNPLRLFEMSSDGQVNPIGGPIANGGHDLVRINSGRILGIDFRTDSIYSINPVTGTETLLATASQNLVAGLAYDPSTDTVYTLAQVTGDIQALHEVDPITGQLGPAIGSGLDGLSATSDMAFDTVNNRIVGFDNSDNEFFEFLTDGTARTLSTAARPLQSWSLAFDGTNFVMFDQGEATRTQTLVVNPDTGEITNGFSASQRAPSEALFHAKLGNVPYQLSVAASDVVVDLNFGLINFTDGSEPVSDHPTVISEVLVDFLFGGSADTDQVLEFRGEPGGQLNDGTYFVIVDEQDNEAGVIHGIFDLSNQPLGNNGFLTILQKDSPYSVDPDSAVLQSITDGFGSLPGGIYTDSHPLSDRIDFIVGANSYFLIETEVPPQLGDDIDADDDGFADPAGVKSNWNVLDSISMHPFVFRGSQAYGDILFAENGSGTIDPTTTTVEPGVPIVVTDTFGYAGRVGASVGSDPDDWVYGMPSDAETGVGNNPPDSKFELEGGFFGTPSQEAYMRRDLDHFGEPNFVGGVRGTVQIGPSLGDMTGVSPQPAVGLEVFADQNNNGRRDLITHVVDPDDAVDFNNLIGPFGQEVNFPLTNTFDGVTITPADSIIGISSQQIQTSRETVGFFTPTQNFIFSQQGIDRFGTFQKLRFDFYRPASEVSIQAIGPEFGLISTTAVLEAYDANDQLITSTTSGLLLGQSRQTITVRSQNHDIAYVLAYGNDQLTNSTSARFDNLVFRQLEAGDVTDANGQYELKHLFPGTYDVMVQQNSQSGGLIGGAAQSFTVNRYENYVFNQTLRPNTLPEVEPTLEFTVDENLSVGSSVGFVSASDADAQGLTFELVDGAESGLLVDSDTGELTVGPNASLNFESTPQIQLVVRVSDSLSEVTSLVTINLNDVNEAPVVQNSLMRVAEGTPAGTAIGQIEAVDPDVQLGQQLTYQAIGGSGIGILVVDPNNGLVTLSDASGINFEAQPMLNLFVRVSDNANPPLSTTINQQIEVVDQNDTPAIRDTNFAVFENTTGVLATLAVVDPDVSQTHRFQKLDGFDGDLFEVTRSGQILLRSDATLDFEQQAEHQLRVLVVDDGAPPLASEATVTITVADVNEAPILTPTTASVDENAAAGTLVTTLGVVDPENSGAAYEIALLDEGDASNYDFDPVSRQLTVAEGAQLDFETSETSELAFQISDPTGVDPLTRAELIIAVGDNNDPPTVVTNQFILSELAQPGSVVGRVEVQINEPDRGDIVTVEIVGGNAADRFTLDPNTRVLRVAAGATFDADNGGEDLQIDVRVSDLGGLSSVGTIDLVLNNVNEPPVIVIPPVSVTLSSGEPLTITLPTDAIVDPEGKPVSVSIFGPGGALPNWLNFNKATRTLSGLPSPLTVGTFTLTLRAFEPGPLSLFSDSPFTIDVNPGTTPLTNQRNPLDVDANGDVASLDALRVVNFIGRFGSGVSINVDAPFSGFVDTNGDGKVTAGDALRVINGLSVLGLPGESEQLTLQQSDEEADRVDRALDELLSQPSLF